MLAGVSIARFVAVSVIVGTVAAGGVAVVLTSGPLAIHGGDAPVAGEPIVSTFAGSGAFGPVSPERVDGPASAARFNQPNGLAMDGAGALYVSDLGNNAIRRIDAGGNVTTLAGGNGPGLRDGPGTEAQFFAPGGLAIGADGSVYVADAGNHRIRRIAADGNVETVAGSGPTGMGQGGFADGPALEARFNLPKDIVIADDGTIYVADTDNARIRIITPGGMVSTFAGSGRTGLVDGRGDAAQFSLPSGIALGPEGSVYVADQPNSAIRRVAPDGTVTTVSATGLQYPADLAVGPDGTLYVADTSGHRIVSIDARGAITLVAGTGKAGLADGRASSAEFRFPGRLLLANGRLFIADSENQRVRLIVGLK